MKLTQFNTKIFVQELETLVDDIAKTNKAANDWLEDQERRDKGFAPSQWTIQIHRETLENRLNDLRIRLATVYDFQGDRGMVDFLVGHMVNGNQPVEEPEEDVVEYDPIDDEILKALEQLNFKRPRELKAAPRELMPGSVSNSTLNIGKPPANVS